MDLPIDYSGYMKKKGSVNPSFKRRWFELSGVRLFYYKKHGQKEPQGVILLKNTKASRDPSKLLVFSIAGPHLKRKYILQAETEKECIGWVQAINDAGKPKQDKVDVDDTKSKSKEVTQILSKDKQSVTLDDFEFLCVVGRGSFGKVVKVKKKDSKEILAMKILKKDLIREQKMIDYIKTEKKVLQSLQHPFIVSLRYAFQTDSKLYMVMDFLSGGELFYHLNQEDGKFNEDKARYYAAELILAIEYLHSKDIIYRDLKPENCVLDKDGHVVLTDFGLAKQGITDTGQTITFCGTPEYLAPEIIQGNGYAKPVDWWSLGILLYEMICGLPPFYSENMNEMYQFILKAPLKFPKFVSQEAQSLLKGLLNREPKQRFGAKECKSHPFFSKIDYQKLEKKQIPTPFIPKQANEEAKAPNFDTEFTSERPVDSVVVSRKTGKEDFSDF